MEPTLDIKIVSIIIVSVFALISLLYCTLDYYGLCSWQWHDCCCCCYENSNGRCGRRSNRVLPNSSETNSS